MSKLDYVFKVAVERHVANAGRCCAACEETAKREDIRVAVQHGAKIGYQLAIEELRELMASHAAKGNGFAHQTTAVAANHLESALIPKEKQDEQG